MSEPEEPEIGLLQNRPEGIVLVGLVHADCGGTWFETGRDHNTAYYVCQRCGHHQNSSLLNGFPIVSGVAVFAKPGSKTRPDDQVLPDATPDLPVAHDQVIADLKDRLRVGLERYGQGLRPLNGRDALQDEYEELLDQIVYKRIQIDARNAGRAQWIAAGVRALQRASGMNHPDQATQDRWLNHAEIVVDALMLAGAFTRPRP